MPGFSNAYNIFLILHVAAVVVGLGPSALTLLPGGGDVRQAVAAAGRTVYAPSLIAAGLFGILLIFTSPEIGDDRVWEFSQAWISLAFLVWIAMIGVQHAMVLAGRRKGDATLEENGHKVLTVLFVVMLYLMVFKPGY